MAVSTSSFWIPLCRERKPKPTPDHNIANDVPITEERPKSELVQNRNLHVNSCHICLESCKVKLHKENFSVCNSVLLVESETNATQINIHFKRFHASIVQNVVEAVCKGYRNCSNIHFNKNCSHLQHGRPPTSMWHLVESILLLISLLSLLFTVFIHLALPEMRNLHGKNISCFTAALLVSQMFLLHDFDIKTRTWCTSISIIGHYFWLVVFTWTSILAYDIARTFNFRRLLQLRQADDNRRRFGMYCLVGWGIPLVLVSVTTIVLRRVYDNADMFGKPPDCFLNFDIAIYTMGIPIFISMVFNIVCFGIIIHGIETHKRKSNMGIVRRNGKQGERFKCLFYGKISVMCGMFWILFIMMHYFEDALRVFSSMLLNFQGILIFFTTVLFNRRARGAVKRRISRSDLPDQTASNKQILTIS